MATVSDIIEEFILSTLEDSDEIDLSRNELAEYFGCAPSQINYVLSTRFNFDRGFVVESRRGGGGFIRLERIKDFDDEYLKRVLERLKSEISYKDTKYLIEDLISKHFLSNEQAKILLLATSDKALSSPVKMEGTLRANIIRNVLINIFKEGEN
ncbi:MAG: CtsR family transcriptional regulator [Christensenellales bacterium]